MSIAGLGQGARRLIAGAIASVPHLEALLLLRAEPRAWGEAEVASRIYVAPERAGTVLAELTTCGLLEARDGGHVYHPTDAATASYVDELADAYARHVVEITSLIHSRTDRAARQFADAFLIRKGDAQ